MSKYSYFTGAVETKPEKYSYFTEKEEPSLLSRAYGAITEPEKIKQPIREKLGIPAEFDLREKVGGLAERGLEFWRKETEPTPLREAKTPLEQVDVILGNIKKQALSVPRFPIDIAQQIFFDEKGEVRKPAEVGKAVVKTGGEFLEYGRQNFENYATYISPLSSSEARKKAIEEIAEDPLGLAFVTGLIKGGIKGAKRIKLAIKRAKQQKGLPIEEPSEVFRKEEPITRETEFAKEIGEPSIFEKPKKKVYGAEELKFAKELKAKGVTEKPAVARAKEPRIIDGESYLAQHGASRQDIGEAALHKNIPEGKIRQKLLKIQSEKDRILLEKREQLRKEYNQKVEAGEIRPPTRIESLIRTAKGHPDNEAVMAARRLLEKKGIDWAKPVAEYPELKGKPKPTVKAPTIPPELEGLAKITKKHKTAESFDIAVHKMGPEGLINRGGLGDYYTMRSVLEKHGFKDIESFYRATQEGRVAPEGEITELHAGIPLPDPIRKRIELATKKLFRKPEGVIEKRAWNIKRDWYYKKEGLTWKHMDKWDRELRDQFSKKEREDMMFYRQRTGNIFKKGDTPETVESRLSQKAKDFVDGEINEHINNMRKWYNESPWTKDIVAREEVIKTYLTGVYSGNIKKGYEYLVGLKGRSFVTNNFMRNKKTYLSFDEAFREAGLVPRFRDMADQLAYQDAYLIKNLANNELIGKIHKLEKQIDTKLIVRSNSKLYDEAKSQDWIPYDDPYLRSYVAGKKADGSPAWATTKAPALLHPELSRVIVDVFRKDAFKPDIKFWRGYDTLTDFIRTTRVSLSGFHFVPLAESLVGGKGVGALNIPGWIKKGRELLRNPEFMTEALGSGLKITAPREVAVRATFGKIQGLVNRLEAQGGLKKVEARGISLTAFIPRQITHFLFHKYMPLLKVNIFMDYKHTWLKTMEKKGVKITEPMRKEALTDIAKLTNDQFGAQVWQLMRTFNDPKVMKWIHRFVGYPDWTISALRQAGAGLEGGIRGKLGRRYWLRYGIAFVTAQNVVSYINTGFYNKEDGSMGWSLDKAHSTFENEDPTHKLDFQLPDVEFTIAGKRINLGREAKHDKEGNFTGWGRKRYSHFGKQMLEIPRYATNTISQVFAKSAPLIQIGLTQVMGGKPYKGEIFPARGEFVEGEFKAWKGTKAGTKERQVQRLLQLMGDVLPFSIQQIRQTGPGTATLTPISKGLSLFASRDYLEKAIKAQNIEKLKQIVGVLIDGGYSGKSIERTITMVTNKIKRESSRINVPKE